MQNHKIDVWCSIRFNQIHIEKFENAKRCGNADEANKNWKYFSSFSLKINGSWIMDMDNVISKTFSL